MAERLEHYPENHEKAEKLSSSERKEHAPERSHESKQERTPEKPGPDLAEIKKNIEHEAKKAKEISLDNKAEKNDSSNSSYLATQELKAETLRRTIKRIQKKLPKGSRTLSRAVHQPVISSLSRVGEKTIARPTGIVTGSLLALLGSSYLLFSAKYYGYRYNFSAVIVLFAGGYLAGLVLEFGSYLLKRVRGAR